VKPAHSSAAKPWLVLAACALICVGFWRWARNILVPAYNAQIVASGRPIGNNSDLYPRWLGTRELLLHGRDPYSAEVTREIQSGFYGRPLNAQNPADPKAQEAFVYPLYVVFLLAPTATLPFGTVVAIFRSLLLLAIALSVPIWAYAMGLRPNGPFVLSGILLTIGSYPAFEEYAQQNLAALVIFFIAAGSAAIISNRLALGGFLLALATMKPDITAPLILWFLLWAAADWKHRNRLIFSFAGVMLALTAGAEILLPHWIERFAAALREYPGYGADPSILQVFLPSFLARVVEASLLIIVIAFCWRWRHARPKSDHFRAALACVVSATLVFLPKQAAYNQLLLIPALLLLFARPDSVPNLGLLPRALVKAAFACQIWQWLSATVLCGALFGTPAEKLRAVAAAPLYTLLALPPITFLSILSVRFSAQPEGKSSR
jgi:hypothetical protein